jgi:hypothetical protein
VLSNAKLEEKIKKAGLYSLRDGSQIITLTRKFRLAVLNEPPCAEPHAGWFWGWRLDTSGYPIRFVSLFTHCRATISATNTGIARTTYTGITSPPNTIILSPANALICRTPNTLVLRTTNTTVLGATYTGITCTTNTRISRAANSCVCGTTYASITRPTDAGISLTVTDIICYNWRYPTGQK